jgi:hypothetical protein
MRERERERERERMGLVFTGIGERIYSILIKIINVLRLLGYLGQLVHVQCDV